MGQLGDRVGRADQLARLPARRRPRPGRVGPAPACRRVLSSCPGAGLPARDRARRRPAVPAPSSASRWAVWPVPAPARARRRPGPASCLPASASVGSGSCSPASRGPAPACRRVLSSCPGGPGPARDRARRRPEPARARRRIPAVRLQLGDQVGRVSHQCLVLARVRGARRRRARGPRDHGPAPRLADQVGRVPWASVGPRDQGSARRSGGPV
jgi:hypothetical protein